MGKLEGAYVFITGRRDPELAAAVKEIGRNVTGVRGDVSNIVFANAGVVRYAPLGGITEELYDSIFDVNVKGLLFTCRRRLR